ncbi:MAG: hypothetical protein KA761_00340 [Gemmatimonadaceae bacterium]|nr:hypothetical protein [Gemmatimonadaceae bacterium]
MAPRLLTARGLTISGALGLVARATSLRATSVTLDLQNVMRPGLLSDTYRVTVDMVLQPERAGEVFACLMAHAGTDASVMFEGAPGALFHVEQGAL